ncbi:flagellar filament capping protein FliD [Paenibacillus sp. S150]|uniref:flagellar filament capping protein FliD n=1 Tax=Paenibacillus sp. S150 TaxID=2749826 RepID=UPI001C58245D|nr:flagellar filament capping protein FliD [Paenibacillus sp. S150]MBW4081663.1 flagellar filament capping protein FliD [Paenibacillus sp. S150]
MVTRITGLASGMDIDAMVKKLMTAESAPLNKLNQQKQLMEWKRENYRETSVKLVSFLQDKLDGLSKSSTISAQKATVTGNTSAVSAKATATASGSLEVRVTTLATAARVSSSAAPAKTDSTTADWGAVKLSAITGSGIDASSTDKISVTIGDASIEIDPQTETLSSFVTKINASTAGVSAVYDSATGQVSLMSKATGAAGNDIELGGDGASVFTSLKLSSKLQGGVDAELTVNGMAITRSSNSFSMNGVELTLNSVSGGTATNIEVTKDVDALVTAVQGFVDAYNEVLSFMNSKVSEERYSKYSPLTTDQKADMTDDEIELWTTKAKSGMLKNDSILSSAISSMRTAIVEGVTLSDGSKIDFTQLGITTGSYETKGKLILNTDKLKTAIENNPEIVTNFLGNKYSTSSLSNTYTAEDGILARMKKISNSTLVKLAETAGTSKYSSDLTASFLTNSTMGTNLLSLDKRISDLTDKLTMRETNYYKKFTAMETAINKYNNISSSLSF